MSDFYYLYDPADNLALGQAIHLANTDGGMSYIVPFANKSGHVDATDPASAGLGVIETAIAAGPLHTGGSSDPISNRLTPTQFQGRVSAVQWTAIKAMVKASIQQAAPAGWSEASLEAAGTTYSVISADGYSKLRTDVFTGGAWKDADTSDRSANSRGNPFIAFGGVITEEAFVDYSGHFIPTAAQIGNSTISPSGAINFGEIYTVPHGYVQLADDSGSPVYGLTIDAGSSKVTLVNFSATSQGLGRRFAASDNLGFTTSGGSKANGIALFVHSGNLTLGGDFVIDQFTQVVQGTAPKPAALEISGASSHVTFDKARMFLGSVRGYESIIGVDRDASLEIKDSTIYGFSSSNSNAPLIPGQGLDWAGFSAVGTGSAAINHLISSTSGGSVTLNGSTLLREDYWQATGAFATTATSMGKNVNWTDNDYKDISSGDLHIGAKGKLEIINSKVLGTITTQNNSSSLLLKDSVVGGSAIGTLFGGSLVQLKGGITTIENSLVDSLDAQILDDGSFSLSKDTHILASATPWKVATTNDPAYTSLASFAGPSSLQTLQAWADKESAATSNKAVFNFQGPETTLATPSARSQTLAVLLSEATPPRILSTGAISYALTAGFQAAVSGFDTADLQTGLGSMALAAGWQVAAAPTSRDGGRTWSFSIESPVSFSAPVPLKLAAGAAGSTLVSGLSSEASNSFNLLPIASGSSGGGSGSSSGGSSKPRTPTATRRHDVLIGSSAGDTFVFPDLRTGVPVRSFKVDRILNYNPNDRIDIQGVDDQVMGAPRGSRRISTLAGVAETLSVPAIARAIGAAGLSPHHAAMVRVHGYSGSFLVVNNGERAFRADDMLVHLEGFSPAGGSSLSLI